MRISKQRAGELFILSEVALWGLFPVITILSFASSTPLVSLGWSTFFATLFFSVLLTIRKKWGDVFKASSIFDTLRATFFIGFLYYGFFFFGLQYTSAGNASIVALISEVFFSYCFFHVWHKHSIPKLHILGGVCMVIGALIVLYPTVHSPQLGDMLIIAASFMAPFGNFFQQRARKKVSSESIMFIRSILTTPLAFTLAYLLGVNPFSFDSSLLALFIVNGVFLFGLSKILWIEGTHRISVTKANALASLAPLVTLLFAYLLLKEVPTLWQLLAFVPMFIGVILLSTKEKTSST